jgi:hypothetical protein
MVEPTRLLDGSIPAQNEAGTGARTPPFSQTFWCSWRSPTVPFQCFFGVVELLMIVDYSERRILPVLYP